MATKAQLQQGNNLRDFTQKDELSDVTLIVQGEPLYVHKVYLAEWSPVWRAMFVANFREKSAQEIELPGKELEQMVELLHCIYPSQQAINEENVHFLLELAEEYQIEKIKQRCEVFLLSGNTDLESLLLAQRYCLDKLYTKCIEGATRLTLEDLEKCDEFQQLEPRTLNTIYKSKINTMRDYASYIKEKEVAMEKECNKVSRERDRIQSKLQTVKMLWETPSKRCYRHMGNTAMFDFSCRECNEKVYREIKKLCSELPNNRIN
ncbi:BTB and MATH domain-containing protein 38-like [Lingula anatina]|uniref:BTB and MATH domain-containing protein 38-like n=1 Tax=Lingula anatina TaxID=7574 RepID=A0A1S3II87_LINAN|nr:BTB and MATH domain-containing protein 38-like [Lingula anatina]|eukprot:XP_013397955.1 BTB and MATH domain-containing protein 38-like [Lingula anatina]